MPITDAERRENERAYHLALGRFVDAFARLEFMMSMVLFRYARVPMKIGVAVFSGARTTVIDGYLRRLAEIAAITPEQWAIMEPVLQQLKVINGTRNDILHHGANAVESGQGFVTNALMALSEDRKVVFPISAKIMDDLTFDCRKITLHLIAEHMGMQELPDALPQEYRDILHSPWRYKSPPPTRRRSHPDAMKKEPRSPPQSSPH